MPPTPTTPDTTTYRIFVEREAGDLVNGASVPESYWEPLGKVEAEDQPKALEAALLVAKAKTSAEGVELHGITPDSVELTVAAVSDRNWGEGTAVVELRAVTIWKKRD